MLKLIYTYAHTSFNRKNYSIYPLHLESVTAFHSHLYKRAFSLNRILKSHNHSSTMDSHFSKINKNNCYVKIEIQNNLLSYTSTAQKIDVVNN